MKSYYSRAEASSRGRKKLIPLYNLGQVSLLTECIYDWLLMLVKKELRMEQTQEALGGCSDNEAAAIWQETNECDLFNPAKEG